MNKTIIININSIVFHIEEDAYEVLRSYMIEIKRHFGKSEDSKEILEDIENRIAEMFSEKIQTGRKEVINNQDVNEVISQMGRVSDFDTDLDDEIKVENTTTESSETVEEENIHTGSQEEQQTNTDANFAAYTTSKKLMRDMDDKVFGGVCSGLGHYFNIESKWVRIIFVLFFLFGGSGIFLYFVLWAVMPKALTRADKLAMRGEEANLHNFKKSFDEEMKGIRENFSGAGEEIRRGASSVGDVIGSIFSVIGKIFAFFGLFISGATVIGMFIVFVFNVLNIMGYENPIFYPPLEVLESTSAFFAVTAFTLAVSIPFLALFFVLLRLLFKTAPMNNYASMSLLATWIGSIIMILYFVVVTSQDFKEESTISVEKPLEKKELYIIDQNDVRVIKASDSDFSNKKFNVTVSGDKLADFLRNDVSIRFEMLDSLKAPYIKYNYIAKGQTFSEASQRASKIGYQVKQQGENLIFDSHFSLQAKQLYRDQRVYMVVYLPVGTKVKISNDVGNKVHGFWDNGCFVQDGSKYNDWLMTDKGLKCVKFLEEEKIRLKEEALEKEIEEREKALEKEKEVKEESKNKEEEKKVETDATKDEKVAS